MHNLLMKYFLLLSVFLLLSCSKNQDAGVPVIKIDLEKTVPSLPYSDFVDSLTYIALNITDSFCISSIKKIFVDGDYMFILGGGQRGGISVFDKNNQLLKRINYYGNGPEEFGVITAFSLDTLLKHVCIYDIKSERIKKYTYNGDFVKSIPAKEILRDFIVLKDERNMCIFPAYMRDMTSGIWITDSTNQFIKHIRNDVYDINNIEVVHPYFNISNTGVYYYDHNSDDYSFIADDTIQVLYKFDIKQKIPAQNRTVSTIKDCAIIGLFSNSDSRLMMLYSILGANKFCWTLINKKDLSVTVSENLFNDMDSVQITDNNLYYVNDSTWYRMLDQKENNCNIELQVLHLKK